MYNCVVGDEGTEKDVKLKWFWCLMLFFMCV